MEHILMTNYHATFFANQLTLRRPADDPEKLSTTLMDAQVDLNPHQIEAALFAFQSPLSQGAILADEVGLGKTIEAGIVLSQKWAEGKRKLLIIGPSSLRKQWAQELQEKFFLPSVVLESKTFRELQKKGVRNPFEQEQIVICSYHFARNKADFLALRTWDLVVIDEAHRLRNVYKTSNRIGKAIKEATSLAPKLLLTATPLQNSLMELYGLVSLIDEHIFGDVKSFRSQFARLTGEDDFDELKGRLAPICKRNLRRQVQEYINYTNRIPLTVKFEPTDDEQALYQMVTEFLQQDLLFALPASQRHLLTLILRKLLASSTYAIAGTLEKLIARLQKLLDRQPEMTQELLHAVEEEFESYGELTEEWEGEEGEDELPLLSPIEIERLKRELEELRAFHELALSITHNAKGIRLVKALDQGFDKMKELGAAQKAIIFTESSRTQRYLFDMLSREGYEGKILMFNGQNNDATSKAIYQQWQTDNADSDRVTGVRAVDMRAALVDHFRNEAQIMIATEAASEGINLQFCSLLINYDLPWNPQRIEQRIGRCHRYGQKFDVVVVNFLNTKNAADQRVFQILD
ncbi:MAG: SNF2-related protein [Bacteroidota bacterium]